MPNDYTISAENIIYSSFVKYDRLQKITYETFSNTAIANARELHVFIDLYSALRSIFSEHYRTDISDYTSITTGIINMCSHYREFYRRIGVKTTFYIIGSINTCDINRKFVAEYNHTFYEKSQIEIFATFVQNNFDLLEILCPYLPDIHFIKSPRNYEVSVIVGHLIELLGVGNYPNLIISRDLYTIQLTYKYPFTSILFPFKVRGVGDQSIMIPLMEKPSYKEDFWNLVKSIRKWNGYDFSKASPCNFSILCAMCRTPERELPAIVDIRAGLKIIERLSGGNDLRINPTMLYQDIEISSKIPVAQVEARLKTLDIDYMLPYYRSDPESSVIKFQNLNDVGAINTINARFFANNPIDLNRL